MTYYTTDYLATSPSLANTEQASRADHFFEIKPALEVRFTRHLVGSLYYLFRTLQSAQPGGWTDNQVGTRFTWTF